MARMLNKEDEMSSLIGKFLCQRGWHKYPEVPQKVDVIQEDFSVKFLSTNMGTGTGNGISKPFSLHELAQVVALAAGFDADDRTGERTCLRGCGQAQKVFTTVKCEVWRPYS